MVQILPAKTNIGSQLGQAIGQSFQGGFEKGSQRGIEQQQTERGLNEALKAAQEAGNDPVKLAFAFAKAGAYSPYLERAIGPLYAEAVKRIGAGEKTEGLPKEGNIPGGGTPSVGAPGNQPPPTTPISPGAPVTPKGKPTAPEVETAANEYLAQLRPDLVGQGSAFGNTVPTFDYESKSDLRPEEERKIREDLMAKKFRPENIDAVVNRLREDVKTKWSEQQTKFGIDSTQKAAIADKWKDVQKVASTRLPVYLEKYPPGTQSNLTTKYDQYAAQQPINLTPEAIHNNAMALLQNDMNKLDALKAIPSAPPFRSAKQYSDYIQPIAEAYRDLYANGYDQAVREDAIQNKDLGLEGLHQAIWGEQTNQQLLSEISSKKAPQEYIEGGLGPSGITYNKKYPQEKEKYIQGISKDLSKMSDNDDLILMRAAVLDSGGTEADFTEALKKSGKKFSPFQQSQLQEIQIPRQRPLWEIFSGGPKPFINIIRGKR